MLSILRRTTASATKSSGSSLDDGYDVVTVDDLSAWEFVDASQSDDEDLYSFDGYDVSSDSDGVIGDKPEPDPEETEEASEQRETRDDIISVKSLSVSPPMTFPIEVTSHLVCVDVDGVGAEEEDDDLLRDDYDMDDELVPWKLKDRMGKQRIRKMGKRGGPKPCKSKRLSYSANRPGCLYGKHGFGVQHSFI